MLKIVDDPEYMSQERAIRSKYSNYRVYFICMESGNSEASTKGYVYAVADSDDDWHKLVRELNEKEQEILRKYGNIQSIGWYVGGSYSSPEY
ncbi:MAG: hypothetical protein LBL26_02575, partial [Peptococcaceae bacterium]|nr:hypothetical protein [Peptococcaceae bacterium]